MKNLKESKHKGFYLRKNVNICLFLFKNIPLWCSFIFWLMEILCCQLACHSLSQCNNDDLLLKYQILFILKVHITFLTKCKWKSFTKNDFICFKWTLTLDESIKTYLKFAFEIFANYLVSPKKSIKNLPSLNFSKPQIQ